MKNDLIKKAVDMGQQLGFILMTTSDNDGIPHLTVATHIGLAASGDKLLVAEWFCPRTLANLEENGNVGITVWDQEKDQGYQLIGKKEALREIAVLDGHNPDSKPGHPSPQSEKQVLVDVRGGSLNSKERRTAIRRSE